MITNKLLFKTITFVKMYKKQNFKIINLYTEWLIKLLLLLRVIDSSTKIKQIFKIILFSQKMPTNFSHRALKKRKVYTCTIRELHIENWDVLTVHVLNKIFKN